jgi:hypothetical protein
MWTAGCTQQQGPGGPPTGPRQDTGSPGLAGLFKSPQSKDSGSSRPSDIARVTAFYRPNPWMSFDREGDPDPEGFTFTLYLRSRETGKGVLESGQLKVQMYRIDPRSSGDERRVLVREWVAETDTLVQSTRPHPLFGMGYQPQFAWDKSDDVLGREIEIVPAFITRDGRTIQGQTKSWRVPAHRGS